MTNQHPLTDEVILEIMNTTVGCDPAYFGERHPSPEEFRAAADWQLEQVIKYLASIPKHDMEMYAVYTQITIDIKKAMRPQQQEDN